MTFPCKSRKYKDMSGMSFGRLTVVSLSPEKRYGTGSFWVCQCICGTNKVVSQSELVKKSTKSCGCYRSERLRIAQTTHGLTNSKIHLTWKRMNERCYQRSNASYERYGGKGVTIGWKSFEDFVSDMKPSMEKHIAKYGARNTTIDRIDNTKGYSKENCRWATPKEQALNRRKRTKKTYA